MNYSLELLLLSLSILLIFYVKFIHRSKPRSTEIEAPEPDGAWPIIGHLHLLGHKDQLLHHTLGAMADKYGPAFNIRLGTQRVFVISSWEVAKECYTVNDRALSCRPKTAAMKHMSYNCTMITFAPYGNYWRELKRIVILEFLSNRRIEMLKDVRSLEINFGINELFRRWDENLKQPVVVELNKWLEHMMLSMIVMMVAGKRCFGRRGDETERCHKAVIEFFRLSGVFVVSDAIPFLWWLDLYGYEKQMKKTAKDLDTVVGGWLDEHRQKKKLDLERNKDVKDFIDVMLSLEDEGKLANLGHDADTIIKSTCIDLILGASDTTSVALTWAISLLLNHPEVLKKLRHELDECVGKERQVKESDIENLVFLQAVIRETIRIYPPGPLLVPREAMEDCTIAGYNVKAGTRLVINAWKIQRDTSIWKDPCKYEPERFMGLDHKHDDVTDQKFFLIPFGSGRRSCPASAFALRVLHLTLTRLVHSFDLVPPEGLLVDMTEGPGLTTPKKKPLKLLLTPRLLSSVYGC